MSYSDDEDTPHVHADDWRRFLAPLVIDVPVVDNTTPQFDDIKVVEDFRGTNSGRRFPRRWT